MFDYRLIAEEYIAKLTPDYYLFKCYKTEKEIGFSTNDGKFVYPFESLGECIACGKTFHFSHLRMNQSVDMASWPVIYEGCYCKECYDLDDFLLLQDEQDTEEVEKEVETEE